MTLLGERFSRLTRIPHERLVAEPTPVQALPRLSRMTGTELFIKRDDQTSPVYGGNKVRKLEFLLGHARARGDDSLVTIGAFGSHHVLATSTHGARAGFAVHAVLVPQPWTPHVGENLRADLAAGAQLHPVRRGLLGPPELLRVAAKLRLSGRRPYMIPHGGSSPVGALGYVEAGLELAAQIDAGSCPEPDAIYVALGSCGTVAGLAIGLAAAGLTTPIIAARVTDRVVANRWLLGELIDRAALRLQRRDQRFPSVANTAKSLVHIDDSGFGAGYGAQSDETKRAQELARADGFEVDPTYTGKTLAVMLRHAEGERRGQTLLYLHTLSSADMSSVLRRAPALPRWTDRYVTR